MGPSYVQNILTWPHLGATGLFTHWSSTESKALLERESMSSESEISDYSQTLSEPEKEVEEEEDDDVQVILSQIEP